MNEKQINGYQGWEGGRKNVNIGKGRRWEGDVAIKGIMRDPGCDGNVLYLVSFNVHLLVVILYYSSARYYYWGENE